MIGIQIKPKYVQETNKREEIIDYDIVIIGAGNC